MSKKAVKQVLGAAFTLLSGVPPESAKDMHTLLFECSTCEGKGKMSNGQACKQCNGTGELFG